MSKAYTCSYCDRNKGQRCAHCIEFDGYASKKDRIIGELEDENEKLRFLWFRSPDYKTRSLEDYPEAEKLLTR